MNGFIKNKKFKILKDGEFTNFDGLKINSDRLSIMQTAEFTVSNCIYMDELGFVPNAEEFYESVYPTITSGPNTKVIITSTPKGLNYFYKMWIEAETGRSSYVAYDVKWYEHPDRDQEWYNTQCKNLNQKSVDQEINCVAGDTIVNIDGKDVTIESIYQKLGNINNNISINSGDFDVNI